jgi:hypothetical protein
MQFQEHPMPALFPSSGAARALASMLASMLIAQAAPAQTLAVAAVSNSGLDAQLLYQLLIGEMELRSGEASTA